MMIELTKIVSDRGARPSLSDEDDAPVPAPVLITTPVSVNPAAVRCFYPRRDGRPGTRLTFTDGGGFPVTEAYAEVAEKMGRIGFVN